MPTEAASVGSFFKRHPVGFFFVFWGELAERASYYGMQALLALYLVDVYRFSEHESGGTVEYFTAACYLLPLLGGWLADRYLGKYWTIVYFSLPYVAGHVILGGLIGTGWLYLALALLALGAGAVKPNTSTLMGQIYEAEGKQENLTEAFAYYYAAINLGAAAASLTLPVVKDHYGYKAALMGPAVLMAVALAIFAAGRPFYPRDVPASKAPPKTPEQVAAERATLRRLGGIFGMIVLFWLVHDQMSTTWLFMARDSMDLNLLPGDYVLRISPGQLNGINPLLIVFLAPFFQRFWEWAARRTGIEFDAPRKMEVGFWLSLACMVLLAFVGLLEVDEKPTVWWVLAAIVLITLAELCVSTVGLQFAFEQAAEGAKSTIMAAFLLTVFVGDSLGGFFVSRYYGTLPEWQFFGMQAVLMLFVAVGFRGVAERFRGTRPVRPS